MDTDIRKINHPKVVKRVNMPAVTISIVLILSGILTLVFGLTAVAILLLALGIIFYFVKGSVELYEPTGSHVKSVSIYTPAEKLHDLKATLKGELNDSTPAFTVVPSAGGRLDVIVSADGDFAAWQIFHFIPHRYEPLTEVHTLTGPPAKQFIRYIERCKK
ncbi:MAG: hypothetical protein CVT97_06530 [Bacteroidetes bacterium HGW-Bacteroidetes-14]|jgi:hypothetical protein|nr:MAG: hypothetical protein CVT97_06530 [Bacteroidetes bacterium HGW-Bacteroidetes-14]